MKKHKILFYCQYLLGLGHLTRSLALAKSLSAEFEVYFLLGGPKVDRRIDWDNFTLIELEPLLMHESNSQLYSPQAISVEEVFEIRKHQIEKILNDNQFDVFVTELYPFGRRKFRKEIISVIELFKKINPKGLTVSSVRDILVESNDHNKDQSMIDVTKKYYDLVLVHSDPKIIRLNQTFPLATQVENLLHYTGFVTESKKVSVSTQLRSNEILISLGGGSVGAELMDAVLSIAKDFSDFKFRFKKSPYMPEDLISRLDLAQKTLQNVFVEGFSQNFEEELCGVRLSISMGGYNTVMNVLNTKTPALIYAYDANHEQNLRGELLENLGYLKVLNKSDLESSHLIQIIKDALCHSYPSQELNLSGGIETTRLLKLKIDETRSL